MITRMQMNANRLFMSMRARTVDNLNSNLFRYRHNEKFKTISLNENGNFYCTIILSNKIEFISAIICELIERTIYIRKRIVYITSSVLI